MKSRKVDHGHQNLGTVDRDIEVAISEFAPGSETSQR